VEKYSKGKKMFSNFYTKCTTAPKPYIISKPNFTLKEEGNWDKGKATIKEFP